MKKFKMRLSFNRGSIAITPFGRLFIVACFSKQA